MHSLSKAFFALCVVVSVAGSAAAQQTLATPNERLVTIAPCRLVDTRLSAPADAAEEKARKFDVASSRCGRFVPSVATAYAMRITPYDRANEGKVPPQAIAAQPELTHHPAGPSITFPVPPGTHITVDLEGYYVPPNTPTDPIPPAAQTNGLTEPSGASHAASTGTALRPKAQSLHDGTAGEMYLDASRYWPTGVFGISNSTTSPWVMFMSGRSDGTDGFGVYNSNFSELMRVSSNGPIRLTQGWSYLSGRIDYRETPNIVNNTVSEIQIVNPRDASGGATNRVTFYDATSNDEVNSPPTTKYRAFTNGINNHADINFDSQIGYSFPNSPEYYYRAYSQVEGAETFWLKAATSGDAYHNTRADMFVSGTVGIGTASPVAKLQVEDLNNNTELLVSAGDTPGSPNSPTMTIMRKDGNHAQLAKFGIKLDAADSNKFKLLYGAGGGFTATPLVVDTLGNVGIGVTNPSYPLSVAGTIQTSTGVRFPDGIVQTAAYPFNSTSNTSDLNRSVAGLLTSSVTNSSGPASLAATGGNGMAYVRLASTAAPIKDWRIGIVDATGIFKIRDNTVAGTPGDLMTINGSAIHFNGDVDATTIHATYQDVAEWVPAAGILTAGTVVVLNREMPNEVRPSSMAYDTAVAGVVSGQPGVLLGVAGINKAKIATTGRVKVRVDARNHPVNIGDLLVTSDTPGTAMLSEPLDINGRKFHQPGTLIGKALEPLASGEGVILVLLSLQ